MTVMKLAAVLRSSKGEMNCVEAEWRIVFEDKSVSREEISSLRLMGHTTLLAF